MTEEIIIDGVNVAGCNYLDLFTERDEILCRFYVGSCESNDNCYYKQLQRLKQENEVLIERDKERLTTLGKENLELKQENEELKKQIESDKGLITVGGKQQYELTLAYDNYRSALEEIREIAEEYKKEEMSRIPLGAIEMIIDNTL